MAQANAGPDLYVTADEDYETFWADLAEQKLDWFEALHEGPSSGRRRSPSGSRAAS